jgi:N-dimethylarginine dimethylaminohydrolase
METFLLCPPDYFSVEYSINPWMTGEKIDMSLVKRQWENLRVTIEHVGGNVKIIKPVKGLPDMVFAANSGIVHGKDVVLSRMKHKERRGESKHYRTWFVSEGYSIIDLIPGVTFEGCGDSLIYRNSLIGGYGFRSDKNALEVTASTLGLNLFTLELVNPRFYHLDTCFCRVSSDKAIYFPDAFKDGEIDKLQGVIDLIPVTEADARLFMCNSMLVNDVLLIPSDQTEIAKKLRNKIGIKTCTVNVSEFLKSGGSIQCLCLKL